MYSFVKTPMDADEAVRMRADGSRRRLHLYCPCRQFVPHQVQMEVQVAAGGGGGGARPGALGPQFNRVLKRAGDSADSSGVESRRNSNSGDESSQTPSLEEREARYLREREKIFGSGGDPGASRGMGGQGQDPRMPPPGSYPMAYQMIPPPYAGSMMAPPPGPMVGGGMGPGGYPPGMHPQHGGRGRNVRDSSGGSGMSRDQPRKQEFPPLPEARALQLPPCSGPIESGLGLHPHLGAPEC